MVKAGMTSKAQAPVEDRGERTDPPPAIDRDQSATIKVARVLCIIFVTSAHAWPGSDRILAADVTAPFAAFYFVVIGLFGRSSVPLLSVISGLLFVSSFYRRGASSVIRGKFKTLIVPMVAWSIPMIAILFAEPMLTNADRPEWGAMDWINMLFSITQSPANGPLHFFRDIFVMVFYGCAILALFSRHRIAGIVLAVAIALLEQKAGGFLVFRNQIAFLFIAGLLMALLGAGSWRPSWPIVIAALGLYAFTAWAGLLSETADNLVQMRFSQLLPRIAVSLFMWRLSYEIVRRGAGLRKGIYWLEPHIFVVFCSHALTVKAFALLAAIFDWSEASAIYPAILLGQMAVFVIVGVVASYILMPFPWLRGKTRREPVTPSARKPMDALGGRP